MTYIVEKKNEKNHEQKKIVSCDKNSHWNWTSRCGIVVIMCFFTRLERRSENRKGHKSNYKNRESKKKVFPPNAEIFWINLCHFILRTFTINDEIAVIFWYLLYNTVPNRTLKPIIWGHTFRLQNNEKFDTSFKKNWNLDSARIENITAECMRLGRCVWVSSHV